MSLSLAHVHEEIVGSTELARAVAPTLDRAAAHPITIHRERADDITMIRRDTWLQLIRSAELHSLLLSLSVATAQRLARAAAAYPAELHWLGWLDDDDYAAFLLEFAHVVGDFIGDHANAEALAHLLYEWEQSAFALRDPDLMVRLLTPSMYDRDTIQVGTTPERHEPVGEHA